MATNEKTTARTTKSIGGECGDGYYDCGTVCLPYPCPRRPFKDYAELRTVLDALEIHALRYFLEGENVATRKDRAAEIIKALQPVLELVNALTPKTKSPRQASGYPKAMD